MDCEIIPSEGESEGKGEKGEEKAAKSKWAKLLEQSPSMRWMIEYLEENKPFPEVIHYDKFYLPFSELIQIDPKTGQPIQKPARRSSEEKGDQGTRHRSEEDTGSPAHGAGD